MEITEHEQTSCGGIIIHFHRSVNQVINLKLSDELIAAIGSNNQLAKTISNLLNPQKGENYGK
jgi:hypothetical protein